MGGLSLTPASWVVRGATSGPLLVTTEPLSFWGGLDPVTGEVIDRRHPLSGERLTGRVLAVPHGRGSCSASGVLLEAICNGTGPLAIITSRIDPIIGLGAILAEEVYARAVPVVVIAPTDFSRLRTGDQMTITPDGRLRAGGA